MSQNITTTNTNLVPDSIEEGQWSGDFISAVILIILTIVHVVKVYSDLCTQERKSVKGHRRVLPSKTNLYKITQHATWMCIFFYMVTVAINAFYKTGPGVTSDEECKLFWQLQITPWTFAKALLYTVYLLRLITTYGHTKYGYNKNFIYALIGYQILSAIVAPIFMIHYAGVVVREHEEDPFPNICIGHSSGGFYYYTAWDFLMNTVCLILFMVPLRKVIKDAANAAGVEDANRQKTLFKMQYIGAKITVLTAFATGSTVLMTLLFATIQFTYLFPYDMAVNSICIALMTIYYPNKYYERACWLCLQCLPVVYRSESPDNGTEPKTEEEVFSKIESNTAKIFVSADTTDAVTFAAKQLQQQDNNSNDNAVELHVADTIQLSATHAVLPSQTVDEADI
eukprot:781182_1